MALVTVIVKLPWLVEAAGPAQKQTESAGFQTTREPLALCVETEDHCAVVVSHVPSPPTDVVPFGFQYKVAALPL